VTTFRQELRDVHPVRQRLALGLAVAIAVPALALRLGGGIVSDPLAALLFGLAIVGAAFLLSWAAEVAQLDISAGLAIAILALIAVLPEYAVDMVFAFRGGNAVAAYGSSCQAPGATGPTDCSLALANMTGANRLLIGIGWPMVVFIAWWKMRAVGRRGAGRTRGVPPGSSAPAAHDRGTVTLTRSHAIEVCFLGLATVYCLSLPLKHSVMPIDAVVLVTIFAAYTWRISQAAGEPPHLVGPARYLGTFGRGARRAWVIGMFVASGGIIFLCAERFAEALVATGEDLGLNEFLLVQWLAPLASEAPELLVAGLYAWRLNTNAGLGTLVSSKVNQWTLLVGTLPIVFAIGLGALQGLPIDAHQREELFLTAAQSFFALAVLATLSISAREALLLFGLFWAQFAIGAVVPESFGGRELIIVGVVYLLLGAWIFARQRALIPPLLRDGFRTSHAALATADRNEAIGEAEAERSKTV
jgi:cation:H+ antiporter